MPKDDCIYVDGKVIAEERTHFVVELENGHKMKCVLKGKMRRHLIKVLVDDRVQVEISPYSMDNGRICYRYKS